MDIKKYKIQSPMRSGPRYLCILGPSICRQMADMSIVWTNTSRKSAACIFVSIQTHDFMSASAVVKMSSNNWKYKSDFMQYDSFWCKSNVEELIYFTFIVILKVMLMILFTYQWCQSFNTGDQNGMSVGNLVSGRLMQCVVCVHLSSWCVCYFIGRFDTTAVGF